MQLPNALSSGRVPSRLEPGGGLPPVPVPQLVGASPAVVRLRELVAAVAQRDCTVLVNGQSGTGKELVARSIHAQSRRAPGPFIAVDCTALRDTLLESQLFGHVKGAFTGADQPTLGFFRAADGGTLFLDEIGEMDPKTQAKLLRCIQERAVVPLGATKPIPVNVRVIAATHRDLAGMVARGEFREDLYFRLDVVRLALPPLAERGSDVLALADHFLWQLAELYDEPVRHFAPEAQAILQNYPWPGNVRELANVVEHAVVFSQSPELTPKDLPERIVQAQPIAARPAAVAASVAEDQLPIVTLAQAEKSLIARALKATSGNQSAAANLLQVERRRLARKIDRYGLRGLITGELALDAE
jgi:DNA-binding NtrC family response regulator